MSIETPDIAIHAERPDRSHETGISLADFLRARRAAVQPSDVGLEVDGHRRVPGLRRDEVATLAGISEAYYIHLEQGRDRHPSPEVLQALARPLLLSDSALRYVKRIAEAVLPRQRPGRAESVTPQVLRILGVFSHQPALVIGRYRDVLAANRLATALNPGFVVGSNILRFVFLQPQARRVYVNWDDVAAEAVRTLRLAMSESLGEAPLEDLLGDLWDGSEEFRRLWARNEVREKTTGIKCFRQPDVGTISLEYETFTINGSEGQTLSIYSPRPGSDDEQALARLIQVQNTSPDLRGGPDP